MKLMLLDTSKIKMQDELDDAKVERLIEAIRSGATIPPIQVREHGRAMWYVLQDGHHRLEAHKRCGLMIAAEVINR